MSTNIWNESDLISKFLDDLINIIDHLPYAGSIKSVIKYNVIYDFFESWQFDDAANDYSFTFYKTHQNFVGIAEPVITEGIKNSSQANRYIFEFIKLIKHVPASTLEEIFFPGEHYIVDPTKKKLGSNIFDITIYTYLKKAKSGILSPKDFENQFYKIIGTKYYDELEANRKAKENQKPNPFDLNKLLLDQVYSKIYMIEDLEYLFCIDAVNHFRFLIEHNLRFDYDPDYFKNFTKGPLRKLCSDSMHEKLTNMTEFDAVFYLSNSKFQFRSHAPDLRYHELYEKFWQCFNFPKDYKNEISEPFRKFLDTAIASYEHEFFSFESILNDFLVYYQTNFPQLIGFFEEKLGSEDGISKNSQVSVFEISGESVSTDKTDRKLSNASQNPVQKSNSSNIPNAYTYKNGFKNSEAVVDLFDNLLKNGFIAADTDKRDFRRIFENKVPKAPVQWNGHLSELWFLIKLLHQDHAAIENLGPWIWKVTDKLFCDINGKPFGWQRFKGQKKPGRATILIKAASFLV